MLNLHDHLIAYHPNFSGAAHPPPLPLLLVKQLHGTNIKCIKMRSILGASKLASCFSWTDSTYLRQLWWSWNAGLQAIVAKQLFRKRRCVAA